MLKAGTLPGGVAFPHGRDEVAAQLIDDWSYLYWGYAFTNGKDYVGAHAANEWIKAYYPAVNTDSDITFTTAAPTNWTAWAEVPVTQMGMSGGATAYRLKEGIERFAITDINNPAGSAQAQSTIVTMMDVIAMTLPTAGNKGSSKFNHLPGGANVLYMDGHVAYVRYPRVDVTSWLAGPDYADFGASPCTPLLAYYMGLSGAGAVEKDIS